MTSRTWRGRSAKWGAVVVAVGLVLSACTSGGDDDGETTTKGAPQISAEEGAKRSQVRSAGGPVFTGTITEGPAGSIEVPKKKIGLLQVASASYAQRTITNEAQRAADVLGWELVVKDGQGDPKKFAAAVQSFVQQDVDAFLNLGAEPASFQKSLETLQERGVPILNIGGTTSDPQRLVDAFIAPSGAVEGTLMAQWLVDRLDRQGTIAMQRLDSLLGTRARSNAFVSVVEDFGLKVVAEQEMDLADLVSSTTKSVRDQLTANKDIDVIYSAIDSQLLPIVELLKQEGRDDITVIATDTDPQISKALRQYENAATVASPWSYTPWLAFDRLLHHWVDDSPITSISATSRYTIPSQMISAANLPDDVENYPFPDLGPAVHEDWETEGFDVKPIGKPTVSVNGVAQPVGGR